ncbi:hypothetical protein [Streptomyces shenzhenensis]|uniref:hypothetical protein n=1 Tax=Streptomyces shenzhenensis TaxID=943815 RepID=UPI00340ABF25
MATPAPGPETRDDHTTTGTAAPAPAHPAYATHLSPTAVWGLPAALTVPRVAIAAAGVLLLATPLLLPRRANAARNTAEPAACLP